MVIVGVGVIIFIAVNSLMLGGASKDKRTDVTLSNSNGGQEAVTKNTADSDLNATNTPISREELAQGLSVLSSTDISIPNYLTTSQYEKIIASSTLSKEQVAVHLAGDAGNADYSHILGQLFQAGPAFLMRGGEAGIQIFVPYIENVLDDNLAPQGNSLVRVYIDSITDKSGKNILNTNSPFEQNNFFNQLSFAVIPALSEQTDKYYKAERTLRLKGDQVSIVQDVKQISGSVVLNLPVAMASSTLSLDQIVTKSKIKVGNVQVGVTNIKDGAMYLEIKGSAKSMIYVKCFNQNGRLIATSVIPEIDPEKFVGSGFDTHNIVNFDLSEQVDHVEVYAPSQIVSKKYHFAI